MEITADDACCPKYSNSLEYDNRNAATVFEMRKTSTLFVNHRPGKNKYKI
jgi:hypothetical protein